MTDISHNMFSWLCSAAIR